MRNVLRKGAIGSSFTRVLIFISSNRPVLPRFGESFRDARVKRARDSRVFGKEREGANTRIACYERINGRRAEFLLRINWLSTLINVDRRGASFAWREQSVKEREREEMHVRACDSFL